MTVYKHAIYAGTFDPFTCGHEDIVNRAVNIFDEVTIVVAKSPEKKPLFSKEDRITMLTEVFKDNKQVRVDSWDGLIVDYAKNNNIGSIVRGLRPTGDFEIEFQMASMNKNLYSQLETVFLMTGSKFYFVSSSLVKEIFAHNGDISPYVPKIILERLEKLEK